MLADVVEVYRALGRPPVSTGGAFEYTGILSPAVRTLLERGDAESVDGRYELIDLGDGNPRVEGRFPRQSKSRGYASLGSFFTETPTLATGNMPDSFYIADIDYFSADSTKPKTIEKLENVITLIKLLTKLADDHMQSSESSNRLLFILPSDGGKVRRTALMQISPERSVIDCEPPDIDVLSELVDESNTNKLHITERRLLMRSAVSETLAMSQTSDNDLTYLCSKWPDVLRNFSDNLHAYINNFAFDEVRKKIVDAELEYASKVSGAFGDIASKLLALPVSLGAVALLDEAKNDSSFIFASVGLFLVSVVLVFVLFNTWMQVDRLRSGVDFVFAPLFDKSATYPEKLRSELAKRKKALRKQIRITGFTFLLFAALALCPAGGTAWKAWHHFPAIGITGFRV
ncbi:hypothetical protein [Robbsia andropogonis]|uniref:hypothetical protein n=1 Tax=Robbsia andropogonis TaxID=28092 RepID=UPI0004AF774C|nr:hypothetical protein [Robbsia andropogonis]